ncbi:heterokaryon incompatibility protein 6, OR allele [Podospora aff. communis PSN243]|uniref:Heterokaryon incompatibility protein 6, OR allele n=1 Tax=Podospora aff. communis PSN243 TaxID=3040156 RepID=A0AAV9G8D5_9PEZI|nr:heterokaryon incompatibility protein 6, OR allele [Podospora aff. communis PSN243]
MTSPYKPLPTPTSIRILLLAPGAPTSPIQAWLLPCDLLFDHDKYPDTTERALREYTLEIDCVFTPQPDGLIALPHHPFQRYTALSYVWGSVDDPQYIYLGDEATPFAVTKNLHDALVALRGKCDYAGMKLWVDAVCINQGDYTEKEGQLKLMRRVYKQAEEVVAYVGMEKEDALAVAEVMNAVQDAYGRFVEVFEGRKDQGVEGGQKKEEEGVEKGVGLGEDAGALTGGIAKLTVAEEKPDPEMSFYDSFALAQQRAREYDKNRPEAQFIEDFGLPPTNSPLWTSWRRLFASPYFRRIWILQEFALASTLKLQLGHFVSFDISALIAVRHYLSTSSGVKNANYLGHSAPGDPRHLTTDAVAGARGLDAMVEERVKSQGWSGRGKTRADNQEEIDEEGGSQRRGEIGEGGDSDDEVEDAKQKKTPVRKARGRLIEKLATARALDATDERDKVYAVMGLAEDGEDDVWKELVSYAPEVTKGEVYTRFARAMVGKWEGFELLLQAGIGNNNLGTPTWAPDWSDQIRPSGAATADVPSKTTSVQLDSSDNNRLLIPGTVVDEIETISDCAFVNPGAPSTPGMKMDHLDAALWQGSLQVFELRLAETLDPTYAALDPDTTIDPQSKPEHASMVKQMMDVKVITEDDDLFDVLSQESDPNMRAQLREGFESYTKMKIAIFSQAAAKAPPAEYVPIDSPREMHAFMNHITGKVWGTRLCATKGGRVGLVPLRTEVGDRVVVFEGCHVAFVLRPDAGEGPMQYKLVGNGYFCCREGESHAYDAVEAETKVISLV